MNHELIDQLPSKAGLKFIWLHGHDHENFCPYEYSKMVVAEAVNVVSSSNKIINDSQKRELINSIQTHFGIQ